MGKRQQIVRIVAICISVVAVLMLVVALYVYVPVIHDPSAGFIARKGNLLNATVIQELQRADSRIIDVRLESSSGLRVEMSVRIPRDVSARPLAFILGGYGTGYRATRLAYQHQGLVTAALSYPYPATEADELTKLEGVYALSRLARIRAALNDTAPAVMLCLDYLLQQPYVQPQQVELVGVSFGAFLVSIPTVLDPRVQRVWLVQGAADPAMIFAQRMSGWLESNTLRHLLANMLEVAIGAHHLKPEKWVQRISPRNVIVVNSEHDIAFPEQSVRRLHQALSQPHEIIWIKGQHVRPYREEVIDQLASVVLTRIARDYGVVENK